LIGTSILMVRSIFQLPGAPFLRLLLPLCMGAWLGQNLMITRPQLLVALFLIFVIILLISRRVRFVFQPYWGMLLLLVIASFGYVRSVFQKGHFPVLNDQQYFVVADEFPQEKAKTFLLVCQFNHSDNKLLVYLPKSPAVALVKPGSILCFKGTPQLIENEGNPFEFDYRGYLNRQKIGYRIFLKSNEFFILESAGRLNLYRHAQLIRGKLIEILYHSGMSAKNVPLVASIAFGARSEVDKEMIQKFTNTGVIHVLAVSGMNVGLVYIVLDFFLGFLRRKRGGLLLYTTIVLAGIWSYALITGMSASILRAAAMFSFVLVGNAMNRNSNIFNSLAVSAFLLIAWNPSILTDIGFQLSYAAVLSIVVIQPLIYKQCYFKNWLLDKIWLLMAVTIAAQLGTLPFTLLYFHQFPVYFWMANLVVIPLVTLILYLSFAVVILSWIGGFIARLISFVLDWSTAFVIRTVDFIDGLPHAVLKGLNPTLFQILIVLTAFVLFCMFIKHKRVVLLQYSLFALLIFSVTTGIRSFLQMTTTEIVCFNIPGARVLALTSGREVILLYDEGIKDPEKLNYSLKPYLGARGIRRMEWHKMSDSLQLDGSNFGIERELIYFQGIRLYVQQSYPNQQSKEVSKVPAELVWVKEAKHGKPFFGKNLHSRILLYHTNEEDESIPRSEDQAQSIRIDRAVKFTVKQLPDGAKWRLSGEYFDQAYSKSKPLPCLTISASPVVQSTMVEGRLSP